MWKFVRGKSQHVSAERQRLQKELFTFKRTTQHGFPNKPTTLAWDAKLRIAAIGNAFGVVKVFGKCGVEFLGNVDTESAIISLLFVPGEGKLVIWSEDNWLHLAEISDQHIKVAKSFPMEGKLKKISSIYVENSNENLLIGTDGGNIYYVQIENFKLTENVIYQDVVIQNVPQGYKVNPGAVEVIAEQPNNSENLLIGYVRGLMVLWNKKNSEVLQTYVNSQQLESCCWDRSGEKFISSHNDGSYIYWNIKSNEPDEEPIQVYGPYPCKAVTKILWRKSFNANEQQDLLIFSGGMPRASYSDRHTITVKQGDSKHVVFDFTTKVIDFFTTNSSANEEDCEALIILLEEELLAIDLTADDWRLIPLPYLISLHSSAVTFLAYVSNVSQHVWNDLINASKSEKQDATYSSLDWPINGGYLKGNTLSEESRRDILLTGHEDGSVRLWSAGTIVLAPLCTFKSNTIFKTEDDLFDDGNDDEIADNPVEEDEWPPFKKVGFFDPYSDDPRIAIKKISFCGITGILTIAGAAGQIVVCSLSETAVTDASVVVSTVNLTYEKENMEAWKGAQRLLIKRKTNEEEAILSSAAGYQATCIIQLLPPSAVTALELSSSWSLVAVGTAYGLALYDYKTKVTVLYKCTVNPNDFSSLNEPPISRTKSFKKSLRESFRRIRKGRASGRHQDKRRSSGSKSSLSPVSPSNSSDCKRNFEATASSSSPIINSMETRPVERAIEARAVHDVLGNMVRCVYFAHTNIISGQHLNCSLWAGTNNGTVYVFSINVPGGTKRKNEKVTSQLAKEIQLKHRAPVVFIGIIDSTNQLLAEPLEIERNILRVSDNSCPHHVVIASEEQFKIFSLPNLKPVCKLKLTATEGAKVRRVNLGLFYASNHVETCILTLTNLGECIVLSVPDLRRLVMAAVTKREDINGISSYIFTKQGEGLYLRSSSEIQRITLSASRQTISRCTLNLDNGAAAVGTSPRLENAAGKILSSTNCSSNANNSILANEIPEEDEEGAGEEEGEEDEEEEEECGKERLSNRKGFSYVSPKKSKRTGTVIVEEENQIAYNHDVSAITVDSVKDHLNGLHLNEENFSSTHTKKESSDPVLNNSTGTNGETDSTFEQTDSVSNNVTTVTTENRMEVSAV